MRVFNKLRMQQQQMNNFTMLLPAQPRSSLGLPISDSHICNVEYTLYVSYICMYSKVFLTA